MELTEEHIRNRILHRLRLSCRRVESGCWEWKLSTNNKGYGRMKYEGRLVLAHRLAAYACGIIDDLEPSPNNIILHTCNNPRCCHPEHLKKGTQSENMKQWASERSAADG